MPDNNRKVLSSTTIKELNNLYKFYIDEESGKIGVSLTSMNRTTFHDPNKPFSINAVKLNRKVTFNTMDIYFWLELQKDRRFEIFSLFDVHNSINKLKVTYQKIDKKNLSDVLINGFNQIKIN